MRRITGLVVGVTAAVMCWGGSAQAQGTAGCVAGKASTPQKVEGEVLKVDHGLDKLTVRGKDGAVHEFQVSKETLRDLKPGDKIEAQPARRPEVPLTRGLINGRPRPGRGSAGSWRTWPGPPRSRG